MSSWKYKGQFWWKKGGGEESSGYFHSTTIGEIIEWLESQVLVAESDYPTTKFGIYADYDDRYEQTLVYWCGDRRLLWWGHEAYKVDNVESAVVVMKGLGKP